MLFYLCVWSPQRNSWNIVANFRVTSAWNNLERFRGKKKPLRIVWRLRKPVSALVYQRKGKELTTYEFLHWKSNFDNVSFDNLRQKYRNVMAWVEAHRFGLKIKWVHVFKGRVINFQNNLHRALACFINNFLNYACMHFWRICRYQREINSGKSCGDC